MIDFVLKCSMILIAIIVVWYLTIITGIVVLLWKINNDIVDFGIFVFGARQHAF